MSAKLLEILETPHATTDVFLADKEQVILCLITAYDAVLFSFIIGVSVFEACFCFSEG